MSGFGWLWSLSQMSGRETYKVFVSSTFEDLKEYREAAITVVNRYKCVPLAMELFKGN